MSWGAIRLRYRDSKLTFFEGEASPAPGGGSSLVKRGSVTLDQAAIIALPTTAVEVVPGVAGTILAPLVVVLYSEVAGYGNIDGNALLQITYDPTFAAPPLVAAIDQGTSSSVLALLQGTLPQLAVCGVAGMATGNLALGLGLVSGAWGVADASGYVAAPLALALDNKGAGPLTFGDPADALTVTAFYVEIPV